MTTVINTADLTQNLDKLSLNNSATSGTTPPTAIQPDNAKKLEFSQYLEKSGVIDTLTKILVGLYESTDKPVQPLDFIRDYLGNTAETDKLKQTVDELKLTIEKQNTEITELKQQLADATATKQ